MDNKTNVFYDSKKQLCKVDMDKFKKLTEKLSNKQLSIIFYIIDKTDKNNISTITYRDMYNKEKTPYPIWQRTIQYLRASDFIRPTKNAIMVNPNIMFKGTDHNRKVISHTYNKMPKNDI